MSDLSGVRIVITFADLRPSVIDVVRARFEVVKDDPKQYDPDRLGYLGYHMDVRFRADDLPKDSDLLGARPEIQIHTRAESAWADASHDVTYKAQLQLPDPLRRRITRLLALVELFDDQLTVAQSELISLPGFAVARMLAALDPFFLQLARRDFDRELSLDVLENLRPLYGTIESQFVQVLTNFLRKEDRKLRHIYREYADDARCSPLLFQPEALVIFERLESAPVALRQQWDAHYPSDLLDDLARIWGAPLARADESP